MKNPQTTIAPTFLTHIISTIDGVKTKKHKKNAKNTNAFFSTKSQKNGNGNICILNQNF